MMRQNAILPKVLVLLLFAIFNSQAAFAAEGFDHSSFNRVLQKYVDDRGYVNYAGLKSDRGDLDGYVNELARTSPTNAPARFSSREAQLAYWINAYNAFVLKGVLDHYPIESVRDVHALYGFFWRIKFTAGGQKMSLRSLENKILREKYREPRIHFAIVCASEGCPRLAREAYIPSRLDEQLDLQARKFINEDRNVKFDGARLQLSKIFDWFSDDFTAQQAGNQKQADKKKVTDYLRRYLTPERLKELEKLREPRIDYFEYDWRINDQARTDVARTR
jgi:hypothetical protein